MNPVLYILVLALAGMVAITTGVYLLAGTGWATITGGLQSLACAALLSRGLSNA